VIVKDKSIQIRFPRSEIEKLIREVLIREIEKVIKKANVNEEIKMAVTEASIDIDLPATNQRIIELEKRISFLEGNHGKG
jgi:hypothetical protein